MKGKVTLMRRLFFLLFLALQIRLAAAAPADSLDQEMTNLANKLSKSLAGLKFKHVAAIDFTDLQGQPTELGRFLSEHLAVEIVSSGGVSMVDRANIKSILAEHKLTEQGLVNPANAKKLGEFAGVDAILIGNVTALDDGIVLMVKAIATSSADIVAAGRIKFAKTSEIQQLLNRGITTNGIPSTTSSRNTGPSYQDASAIATKDIGSLRVVLKSVLPTKLPRGKVGVRCVFEFISLETQRQIVVALNAVADRPRGGFSWDMGTYLRSSAVDETGGVWRLQNSDVAGMSILGVGQKDPWASYDPSEIVSALTRRDELGSERVTRNVYAAFPLLFGSMTEVQPGQSLTVTMSFVEDANQTGSGVPKVFQIASEIVVGIARTGTKYSYTLHNLMFDRVGIAGRPAR